MAMDAHFAEVQVSPIDLNFRSERPMHHGKYGLMEPQMVNIYTPTKQKNSSKEEDHAATHTNRNISRAFFQFYLCAEPGNEP
jgi:hypothetical protein